MSTPEGTMRPDADESLSELALARRDEIFARCRRAMARRRARRRTRRRLGGASLLVLAVAVVALVYRGGRGGPTPPGPAPEVAEKGVMPGGGSPPENAPVEAGPWAGGVPRLAHMDFSVVRTAPPAVAPGVTAPPAERFAREVGDGELLAALAEAGRPSGLARTSSGVILIPDPRAAPAGVTEKPAASPAS